VGNNNAVTVWNSQDVTMNNVTIYAAPLIGFIIEYGRGIHLINCKVTRSDGRPISTMGDAVHFGSHGGDVIIENSQFSYQGDDGLNIHTAMIPVSSGTTATSLAVANFTGSKTGDVVGLFNASTGFVGTTTANCSNGACTADTSSISSTGGYVADLTLTPARFVVQNNTFSNNRARGALFQTPYGLVQNNTFIGQSLFSVYFVESSFWNEGPGAQDIQFSNNTIESPGIGGGNGAITIGAENSSGVIMYNATAADPYPPIPGINQNLVFAYNTIENVPGAAFYISSANNVILYKNTLTNTNIDSHTSTASPNLNGCYAVYDASNVLVDDSNCSYTNDLLTGSSDAFITSQ
jgi:hypothetical protein